MKEGPNGGDSAEVLTRSRRVGRYHEKDPFDHYRASLIYLDRLCRKHGHAQAARPRTVVITNYDGIQERDRFVSMAEVFSKFADTVVVVPCTERSGSTKLLEVPVQSEPPVPPGTHRDLWRQGYAVITVMRADTSKTPSP